MILLDDFVKDKAILQELEKESMWVSSRGWYDGWWDTPPSNLWEHLIKAIWSHYPDVEQSHGFEWWTNIQEGEGLSWHQDKDEVLAEADNSNIVCPEFGAIFYPYPHKIEGGMLEIMFGIDQDIVERISPVYNRLVMFDPGQFHRVRKVYSGKRRAFIVNLWKNHTPPKESMY